ncbi:MAG: lactate utilization protein, partial [Methanobrevibacter sp.]|nr:lactate utilization protein [Methanobrevibacter sp.]
MKASELETMRKSFNTVKSRSDSIKDSPSTKRLKKRVKDIKMESINNNEYYLNQALESFKRNDIEVRMARTAQNALDIIDELLDEYDAA